MLAPSFMICLVITVQKERSSKKDSNISEFPFIYYRARGTRSLAQTVSIKLLMFCHFWKINFLHFVLSSLIPLELPSCGLRFFHFIFILLSCPQ